MYGGAYNSLLTGERNELRDALDQEQAGDCNAQHFAADCVNVHVDVRSDGERQPATKRENDWKWLGVNGAEMTDQRISMDLWAKMNTIHQKRQHGTR